MFALFRNLPSLFYSSCSFAFFLSVIHEFGVLVSVPTSECKFLPASTSGFPLSLFSLATFSLVMLV